MPINPITEQLTKEAFDLYLTGKYETQAAVVREVCSKNPDALHENIRLGLLRRLQTYKKKQDHKALDSESITTGFPIDNVDHYWLKSKHISVHVKNNPTAIDYPSVIAEIVEGYNPEKFEYIRKPVGDEPKALKVTLSDMHVGLEPNPNNKSIFAYEYNEEIFKSNIDKVFLSIIKEHDANGRFDMLYIDDLGDGLDGWNGQTTRGGHGLEQNMDNEQAFKVFVEGKLMLIEKCIKADIANQIVIRNVSNDNHAGSFASIANLTIKMVLERSYPTEYISFHILNKFIEHFYYGNHTYILTHGKDAKYMFKGLPFELNDKAISFINDYIDHYDINSKYIHLEKGDLHRVGYSRTKKFDYRNYMSFAPPSAWVQHNFGDCYSGYSIEVIEKFGGQIAHTNYYFDLARKI